MGNIPMAKITYAPGCWGYRGPMNNNQFGSAPGLALLTATNDCDCHSLKICPWGEPTMPYSYEYQEDGVQADLAPQNLGVDLTDSVPGSFLTEPPFLDGPTLVMVKRASKEELRTPRDYAYGAAVVRAWNALPPAVQMNINKGWNTLEPYLDDFNIYLHGGHTLDPRPSLATLLDDARGRAGDAIMIMSKKDANLLLHCTQLAFDHLEDVAFPEALEATDRRLLARKDREPYIQVLTRFMTLWRAHIPAGLNHHFIPHESYTFTTINKDKDRVIQRLTAEDICQSVWNKAVNETGRPESYVAEFEMSLKAIDDLFDKQPDVNSYKKALEVRKNWPTAEKMDWSTENMKKVFGAQKPEVQVALSYFALSLWTGTTKYIE